MMIECCIDAYRQTWPRQLPTQLNDVSALVTREREVDGDNILIGVALLRIDSTTPLAQHICETSTTFKYALLIENS